MDAGVRGLGEIERARVIEVGRMFDNRIAALGYVRVVDEGIVAASARKGIVTCPAFEHIVVGVPRDRVVARTADDVLDHVAGRQRQRPGWR